MIRIYSDNGHSTKPGDEKMDIKLDQEKLKTLRKSKAWSQAYLAEVSGISLRTIQRIEKLGTGSPESIRSICGAFSIQVEDVSINNAAQVREKSVLPNAIKWQITSMDKKAAMVTFVIGFAISFYIVKYVV